MKRAWLVVSVFERECSREIVCDEVCELVSVSNSEALLVCVVVGVGDWVGVREVGVFVVEGV